MLRFDAFYYGQILLEFSESAVNKIVAKFPEVDPLVVRQYLEKFQRYKNSIELKDPFQYKTFTQLEQAIDAAEGKAKFKRSGKKHRDAGFDEAEAIANDENVTIYKGDSQHKCVKYGAGYSFCIARPVTGNMYSSYRMNQGSTFYFIFFKKRSKSDPKHIMVLDRANHGWQLTFADNNTKTVEKETIFKEYPELLKYINLFVNTPLTDSETATYNAIDKYNQSPTHYRSRKFDSIDRDIRVELLRQPRGVGNDVFDTLDTNEVNELVTNGVAMSNYQLNRLTPSQLKRYKHTRERVLTSIFEAIDDTNDIDMIEIIERISNTIDLQILEPMINKHPGHVNRYMKIDTDRDRCIIGDDYDQYFYKLSTGKKYKHKEVY